MSDRAINNPGGAFGLTADYARSASPYRASAAVTAKKVVAVGTDARVAVAATNNTATLCIGIADAAIASGSDGLIVERGIVTGVLADGAIARGDILKRSVNSTGAVQATATPVAGEGIAVAIAASAAGVVDVYVKGVSLS